MLDPWWRSRSSSTSSIKENPDRRDVGRKGAPLRPGLGFCSQSVLQEVLRLLHELFDHLRLTAIPTGQLAGRARQAALWRASPPAHVRCEGHGAELGRHLPARAVRSGCLCGTVLHEPIVLVPVGDTNGDVVGIREIGHAVTIARATRRAG